MIKIFSANWILTGKGEPLQNAAVVVKGGEIFDIDSLSAIESKYTNPIYNFGNALIFPAFVNVHTHLELTHLRKKVAFTNGFIPWMRETGRALSMSSQEEIVTGIRLGLKEIHESGTIGIGDITDNGLSVQEIQNTLLYSRVFHEVRGFRNFRAPYQMREINEHLSQYHDTDRVTNHLAPHSPFLVGRKLLQEIEQRESLISLHLATLKEEVEFFRFGGGPIKQMLLANEMFDYKWEVPGTSPVRYFFDNYYYAQNNILVHMVHVSEDDMDHMAESHVDIHICLCPRSHETLGLGIAPARQYKKRGFNLCLGTDNVVVSGDFDMRQEMRRAYDTYQLPPDYVFRMATLNGARALGFEEKIGTIEEGKCGYLLMMRNPFAVDKDPYEILMESDEPIYWLEEVPATEMEHL